MTGEIAATGEIVTGALLARTLEPRAGEAGDGHGDPGLCLNCGTALAGAFCHRCGQSGHVHRTIGAIGHEILHGVFNFEGKLWRTLPMLVWRPGELTRRYIAGERARFVSPMALFLFSVFAMFAVFSLAGIAPPTDLPSASSSVVQLSDARDAMMRERREAIARRDDADRNAEQRARAARRVAELDQRIARLGAIFPAGNADADSGANPGINLPPTGWHALDKGIQKAIRNPALALYKLQSNIYKFSWLLIPLSLPYVWLMFAWRRQYHGYDHAVFVTYSISFMSLLFIVLTIVSALVLDEDWVGLAAIVVPVWHIYRQLRGAYRLRRWSALLRTIAMLFSIVSIGLIFLSLLLLMGLVG